MTAVAHPHVAIACGGTGGHLFPGVAVGESVLSLGGSVTLLVSSKEVDQQAVRGLRDMEVLTLPAVALQGRNLVRFLRALWASRRAAIRAFRARRPDVVLAMGGFTSAGPILAARAVGAATCLHESNTVPGRANRWLAPLADACCVGFPVAAERLRNRRVYPTGTPVRSRFEAMDPEGCWTALGLDPLRPVLAVMGGSQGASGLNAAVVAALPALVSRWPSMQYVHLAGERDFESVRAAHAAARTRAWVRPFCAEMEWVLGAATVAIARSGASTLAEFAAMAVPSVLVPLPTSADNHQFHNAAAFAASGAAVLLEQRDATPEAVVAATMPFLESDRHRTAASRAAAAWHRPLAAADIANRMVALASERAGRNGLAPHAVANPGPAPVA